MPYCKSLRGAFQVICSEYISNINHKVEYELGEPTQAQMLLLFENILQVEHSHAYLDRRGTQRHGLDVLWRSTRRFFARGHRDHVAAITLAQTVGREQAHMVNTDWLESGNGNKVLRCHDRYVGGVCRPFVCSSMASTATENNF